MNHMVSTGKNSVDGHVQEVENSQQKEMKIEYDDNYPNMTGNTQESQQF